MREGKTGYEQWDDYRAHFTQIHCLKTVVTDGWTNGRTDQQTDDGGTDPHIEMHGRI